MKTILFYSDTAEYGGHEILTVQAAKYIAERCGVRVVFVYYEGNARIRRELVRLTAGCGALTLYPLQLRSHRLQSFRTIISFRKVAKLATLMQAMAPDAVVVSQGRIESGSLGLLAAKRSGLRTISYLPMAHHVSECGRPILVNFREKVNTYLYSLPDKIITISASAKNMLVERGATSDVVVVRNGIDVRALDMNKTDARRLLGLKCEGFIAAVIGRLDFRQKSQDFALEAFHKFAHQLSGVLLCFMGSGPDERRLRARIQKLGMTKTTVLLPWRENPSVVYAAIDMLIIPSRFEGVPLVMLEAMASGVPVVASDVDAMSELLPEEWRFAPGSDTEFIHKLLKVRGAENDGLIVQNRNRVMQDFSREGFQTAFARAVLEES